MVSIFRAPFSEDTVGVWCTGQFATRLGTAQLAWSKISNLDAIASYENGQKAGTRAGTLKAS